MITELLALLSHFYHQCITLFDVAYYIIELTLPFISTLQFFPYRVHRILMTIFIALITLRIFASFILDVKSTHDCISSFLVSLELARIWMSFFSICVVIIAEEMSKQRKCIQVVTSILISRVIKIVPTYNKIVFLDMRDLTFIQTETFECPGPTGLSIPMCAFHGGKETGHRRRSGNQPA